VIEARIECVTAYFPLREFGLEMRRGDVGFVPADAARASRELAHAVKVGAVAVRYVERCKVEKKPDPQRRLPPSVRMSRPNRGGMSQPPRRSPQPDEERLEGVTADELRQVVREELRAALDGVRPTVTVDAEALRELVIGQIRPGEQGAAAATASNAPGDPVFIPADIVDKDAQAEIKIESQESEADGLDAAADALKRVRPAGGRRKRKALRDEE